MILGFISLLLTVGTGYIAKICIPIKLGNTLLPCKAKKEEEEEEDAGNGGDDRRKLLSYAENMIWRRAMAESNFKQDYCESKVSTNRILTLRIL